MTRILVVDDCPDQRKLIGHLFNSQTKWEYKFAGSGQEALLSLAEQQADAVVCDLRMPLMDGSEFLESARKGFPLVPVIITTAAGSEEAAVDALASGAADYIPKRHLVRELVERVQRVLSVTKQQRSDLAVLGHVTNRATELILPNQRSLIPAVVCFLQDQLDTFGICNDSERIRVGVAIEETLVNAIVHGNLEVSSELRGVDDEAFAALVASRLAAPPYSDRQVHCAVQASRDAIEFTIRDEGPGFDPNKLPDPTDPENIAKASGRGLLLIRTFMDDVRHNATGNEITLVKKRSADIAIPQETLAARVIQRRQTPTVIG